MGSDGAWKGWADTAGPVVQPSSRPGACFEPHLSSPGTPPIGFRGVKGVLAGPPRSRLFFNGWRLIPGSSKTPLVFRAFLDGAWSCLRVSLTRRRTPKGSPGAPLPSPPTVRTPSHPARHLYLRFTLYPPHQTRPPYRTNCPLPPRIFPQCRRPSPALFGLLC